MKTLTSSLVLCALLATSPAQAALVGSADGKTVYDTDLNITWLSNANLAATESFGLSIKSAAYDYSYNSLTDIDDTGQMSWGVAMNWIGAMNASNYLGYHDWRLPTATDIGLPGCNYQHIGDQYQYVADCGTYSIGSEMSHLYYTELGNTPGGYGGIPGGYGGGLLNTGPFTNLQDFPYWSGTEGYYVGSAWFFNMSNGDQDIFDVFRPQYALVVRDGQTDTVPVPAAAWLFGSGLLGLLGVARRKAV